MLLSIHNERQSSSKQLALGNSGKTLEQQWRWHSSALQLKKQLHREAMNRKDFLSSKSLLAFSYLDRRPLRAGVNNRQLPGYKIYN